MIHAKVVGSGILKVIRSWLSASLRNVVGKVRTEPRTQTFGYAPAAKVNMQSMSAKQYNYSYMAKPLLVPRKKKR